MSDSRHTEDYPLQPTDADLDDESLDAQEPPERCQECGWHIVTAGHATGCGMGDA